MITETIERPRTGGFAQAMVSLISLSEQSTSWVADGRSGGLWLVDFSILVRKRVLKVDPEHMATIKVPDRTPKSMSLYIW